MEASGRKPSAGSHRAEESPRGRNRQIAWLLRAPGDGRILWLVTLILLAAALLTWDPKLHVNGDNVAYIRLAESIRQSGSIWPASRFPPGFPWLLVPVQALFGLEIVPQKILVTAFYLLAGFIAAKLCIRLWGVRQGVMAALLGMTLVPVIEYAHYVMSEIPFLALSLAALFVVDGTMAASGGSRPGASTRADGRASTCATRREVCIGVAAGCLAVAAFWIRSVGLVVVVAVAAALALQGRRRALIACLIAAGLGGLPWAARTVTGGGGHAYVRQFFLINPYYPEFGTMGWGDLATRAWVNLKEDLLRELPHLVWPAHFRSTYTDPARLGERLPWPAVAAALFLVFAGLARSLLRRRAWAVATLLTLSVSVAWPPIWSSARFLVPAAPLFLWSFLDGAALFGRWILARRSFWFLGAVAAALAVMGIVNLAHLSLQSRRYPPAWEGYFKAARWVRDATPADVLVVDRKPGLFGLVSGRRCEGFPREPDRRKLLSDFHRRGVDLVVLSRIPYDDISRYLLPAIASYPEWFDVIYSDQSAAQGETYVFRMREAPRPP